MGEFENGGFLGKMRGWGLWVLVLMLLLSVFYLDLRDCFIELVV